MNIRTSIYSLLLVMGLVAWSTLRAQPSNLAPTFDPYLPGELNERALYALKDRDLSTAVILLERAYRLNPHSPDIKNNLELLRGIDQENTSIEIHGEVIYFDAQANIASREKILDIPALWPESQLTSKP